jgi:hypothetical protein
MITSILFPDNPWPEQVDHQNIGVKILVVSLRVLSEI